MNAVLTSICLGGLMLATALAQNGAPPQSSASPEAQTATPVQPQTGPGAAATDPVTRVAPGSVIPVTLTRTIDAKKVKSGDPVVATVTQDLKSNDGRIVFAKDTKLMGHVTEVQPHSKEHPESEVGIAFDHAVMKSGSEMQIPLSIQAIVAPANSNSANASGGGGDQAVTPAGAGSGMPSSAPPRPSNMGGGYAPPATTNAPAAQSSSSDSQAPVVARGPITANTQGVIGMSNMKLVTAAPDARQGSLVSSEKNNVKLESGTIMLLRVNQ